MARVHLFADEAGNFDFSRKAGASRFFILTTVAFPEGHDALATSLRALRFELAWEGIDFRREFHATDDTQAVRNRVFEVLAAHDFRVDATILEKPKARPALRRSDAVLLPDVDATILEKPKPGPRSGVRSSSSTARLGYSTSATRFRACSAVMTNCM